MTKLVLMAATLAISIFANAQSAYHLNLIVDSLVAKESWNNISFDLPKNKLSQLHESKGEKNNLGVSLIEVNSESLEVKHIHVRGNTSSYFRRKSLNIRLNKKAHFHSASDTFALKKFYAISLNMDKNYIRNKISYEVLSLQNVPVPVNCYSNLKINGESEGLYMIFYPPDEYAIKKCNASMVIRRGYQGSMDKVYEKNLSKDRILEIKQNFKSLYKVTLKNSTGEQLHSELSKHLNLESYFSWLAFNHLFQNGDYADEVYFIWNTQNEKFDIIPWDLDDILRNAPHEGYQKRDLVLENKLIFSFEDKLDVAIANDPFLYKEYLKCYDRLLAELTPEALGKILNNIFQEVYIYFQRDEIISQSKFDQYGLTNLDNLKLDLNNIYESINNRAIVLRRQIETQLEQ